MNTPPSPADAASDTRALQSLSTQESIGLLEKINDPDFKVVELDALNAEAGSGSFNIRDQAIVEQLIGLAHLESINAELIRQGLGQSARLLALNQTALVQMRARLSEAGLQRPKLKILLYGLNFAPELTGVGKYSGEMAAWLAAQGHAVRVVTAPPYYPAWKVGEGFSGTRWQRQTWRGVQVWRCPLWVPAAPGGLKRLLHLASFALSSLPVMLRQVLWRADVVWVVEPALFCAPAAWAVARLGGSKAWLHVQDFEVDAAFSLNLLKGERVKSVVLAAERWLMRRFDVVSTISGMMQALLHRKGVSTRRTVLAPNWVDISAIAPRPAHAGPSPFKLVLGLPLDAVVALYSGNMGAKQGLEVMAHAARLCPAVTFVFCGNQGAGRADLQARCANLPNVHFLDLVPPEQLSDLLALADMHLLPQRADAADLVMPSKLTGMLASGRPVVATAHPATELAAVVNGNTLEECCGLVVLPEEPTLLAQAINELANNPAERTRMGAAGRRYAQQHLHTDAVLGRFVARVGELVGHQTGQAQTNITS